MGNQMFQYAAGLASARESGAELFLDTTFLSDRFPRRQFTYRNYDLDVFALQPNFTAFSKISSRIPIPGFWLGLDLSMHAVGGLLREKKEYVFDPSVLSARGSMALWGRWQTEKYFAKYADEVRAAFQFRDPLTGAAARLAAEIQKTNSVSLHVRRGDYVAFKSVQATMGDTDLGYYDRAVHYITDHADHPALFIFSDDIAWCREHIKIPFPVTYVDDTSRGSKASFHLHLMSLCKNNIIANSSFSWWGAWLNRNPEKIVVGPKRWETRQSASTDILPASWIAL